MTTDNLYEIVSPSDPYTIRGEIEPVYLAVLVRKAIGEKQ